MKFNYKNSNFQWRGSMDTLSKVPDHEKTYLQNRTAHSGGK